MRFEEACSEVNFIINHMNDEDKEKIPKSTKDFFNENKSVTYRVKISPDIELKYQDIKEETKAFLQILYYKYFAEEIEKTEFENMLKSEVSSHEMAIAVYKENKIKTLFNKIINFFKRKKL